MRDVLYLAGVLLLTAWAVAEEPINLACTSLAEVHGSAVNGERDIDNPYYGVPNLFDNGTHMINGINYHYWLGDKAQPYDWVAVSFAAPVTVTEVQVQGPSTASPLKTLLYRGEAVVAEVAVTIPIDQATSIRPPSDRLSVHEPESLGTGTVALKEPLAGITRVELRVTQPYTRLDEWRIMGMVPPGTAHTVGRPRLTRTASAGLEYARIAFKAWTTALFKDAQPIVVETPTLFVITFRQGNLDLYRTTIDRITGKVTGEVLVELVPIPRTPPDGNKT